MIVSIRHTKNEPRKYCNTSGALLLRRSQPFGLGYRLFFPVKPLAYVVGNYTCQYGEKKG